MELNTKTSQVDPEEHKDALEKVESLTKEKDSLKSKKESAEQESTRIRSIATRLNKELAQQKKTVGELMKEKEALASASKNSQTTSELKEKAAKLEKELNSTKTELAGANERNNRLRDRLRQFQKMIKDLREKEKSLSDQLAEAQSAPGTAALPAPEPSPALKQVPEIGENQDANKTIESQDEGDRPISGSGPSAGAEGIPPKKPQEELLRLPPGGFNFGPNEEAIVTTQDAANKEDAMQGSGRASNEVSSVQPSSASPKSTKTAPSAAVSQVASPRTKMEDAGETTEKATRRDSGSKKEMSFKEKLLEKKRRLAEKLAVKRKVTESEAKQAESKDVESKLPEEGGSSEPAVKKPKLGEASVAETREQSAKPHEAIPADKAAFEGEEVSGKDDEGEIAEEVTTAGAKEAEQQDESATDTKAIVPTPANMAFGQAPNFGSPATTFGTSAGAPAFGTSGNTPAFGGSAPAAAFGTAGSVFGTVGGSFPAFGTSAGGPVPAFGGGSSALFGSASAAPGPPFGTSTSATAPFGSTPAFSSGTGLGNQPTTSGETPGSNTEGSLPTMTPQGQAVSTFTFGSSGLITLPTPSQPSRANSNNSPFGVFSGSGTSSGSPFGVFGPGGPRPLFGTQQAAAAAEQTKDEEDEGKENEETTGKKEGEE